MGYHGAFYDTTTQSLGIAGTVHAMQLNQQLYVPNGVSIVDNSKITMDNPGKYNIAFSAQLYNPNKNASTFTIWLRRNGVDVVYTSTDVFLGSDAVGERGVAAWNFFVVADDVGDDDYFEIMVASSQANGQVLAGNPTHVGAPQIPSVIVTVNQVG